MSDYDDTNTIVIFQNDQQGNDKRPTLTGKLNVEGVEYEVALWTRTANTSGNKFWSGNVRLPQASAVPAGVGDEDIPF